MKLRRPPNPWTRSPDKGFPSLLAQHFVKAKHQHRVSTLSLDGGDALGQGLQESWGFVGPDHGQWVRIEGGHHRRRSSRPGIHLRLSDDMLMAEVDAIEKPKAKQTPCVPNGRGWSVGVQASAGHVRGLVSKLEARSGRRGADIKAIQWPLAEWDGKPQAMANSPASSAVNWNGTPTLPVVPRTG